MNLEQMKARLGEILEALKAFDGKTAFSNEEVEQMNTFGEEYETLSASIKATERREAILAGANKGERKAVAGAPKVEVSEPNKVQDGKNGFKAAGEFYSAIKKAAVGNIDPRLVQNAGAFERNGEDGGFLIPGDFRTEIQKKVNGDQSLLPKTRQFMTSSNHLTIPTNETAPWDGTGIQAYWEAEGIAPNGTKPKFGQANLKLHKLISMVKVTEELLEDAPALESYIKSEAPEAILHKINSAIISGDGAGKPLGFLSSGFKYKVLKESGQAADTVLFANVNKMLGRILPGSLGKSIWLVNPAVLPALRAMKFDDAATSPVPVYLPSNGLADAPYGTLFGRPIMPMMGGVKALGDEGDIVLADLSSYTTAMKVAGIKSDISSHVYFETSEMAFKFSVRIAGECLYKSPVSTENGAFEMSSIITLENR